MMPSHVTIDVIATPEGCQAHQELQNIVWGRDQSQSVPSHLLIASARHGGLVLGAYAGVEMVGLLYSFPALHHGQSVHLSHLLGVHPGWRGQGIGERLKWRQRELVLALGFTTIVWTFDPLQAVNARLNIARLGATSRLYSRDYYGTMNDDVNYGLPSDRLTVEWPLESSRVTQCLAGRASTEEYAGAQLVLGAQQGVDGIARPGEVMQPEGSRVLVEIPSSIGAVKSRDLQAALDWRLASRAAFEDLFAAGYVVIDLVRRGERVYYVFELSIDGDRPEIVG